jgi:hypothetical protein
MLQFTDCEAFVEDGEATLISGATAITLTEHELALLLALVQD